MAYCITQDADGFIWVGTETGVSRFDGTHFVNFTTANGLPDIEILMLYGDSRGRVWMAPFNHSVCYYYRGKIYNQDNDLQLRKIRVKENILGFAEDSRGDILMQERAGLHELMADGKARNFDSIDHAPIQNSVMACSRARGDFLVQEGSRIYSLDQKGFSLYQTTHMWYFEENSFAMNEWLIVSREKNRWSIVRNLITGQTASRPYDLATKHLTYTLDGDSLVWFNEILGATQYNLRTGDSTVFLPGIRVSRTFRDRDGDLWFTTLNHGIYRLNSERIRTIRFPSVEEPQSAVTTIARIGGVIRVGNNHGRVFNVGYREDRHTGTREHWFMGGPPFRRDSKESIAFIDSLPDNRLGVFQANSAIRLDRNFRLMDQGGTVHVKAFCRRSSTELLFGSGYGLVVFNTRSYSVTDMLWHERCTAVAYADGVTYVGTMHGLYRITDRSVINMGEKIPFLRKRISCIAISADHTLWIASSDDAGIIGVRNDSVIAAISTKQGLTSDVCRTLLVQGDRLWVGTDKGLNRIGLDGPRYPITRYTSDDGLCSNMINTVFADGPNIYVGTSTGLSIFDERRTAIGDSCRLQLLGLLNGNKDRIADTGKLDLSYEQKDLRLEFVGISYRSPGRIRYRYRMLGLDSVWRETGETYLDYPSLPSGPYTFELQAINRFGVRSPLLTLPLEVRTPFWETVWFKAAVLLVAALLTWYFVARRIRYIRRQQNEREELLKDRAEMENRALQAQMNPHFVFNCLNSIQQFVFAHDQWATNEFITGFARLIRATLHHSSRSFITVDEEIDYLSTYLSLEKMRFKDKMDYFFEVDPTIDRSKMVLPPMLVQPFVENAMRHGLRHKTSGKGFIRIGLKKAGNELVIVVEDNGIGRKKSMEFKTAEHIEYQSKGMSLTQDRIKAIGLLYGKAMRVEVEDKLTADGSPAGTRVTIAIPDLYHKFQVFKN